MIETACNRQSAVQSADVLLATFQRALAQRIGPRKYELWFEASAQTSLLHPAATDAHTTEIRMTVPSAFAAEWVERNFRGAMTEIAAVVMGEPVLITIVAAPLPDCAAQRALPNRLPTQFEAIAGQSADAPTTPRGVRMTASGFMAPSRSVRQEAESGWKRFEDFLVGNPNRLAYESARQMAEAQSDPMRLLYLHGSCGVGKTHLLQSICRRYRELHPNARVRYVTGEQFTNEYIAAIRAGLIEGFRRKTRRLELLVIDDVHFLGNKTATQSECLHTIDAIGFQGSRVVLASDEHPRQIAKCSAALVSRFLSGMVVKVDDPDRETRLALARRFAVRRALDLSPIALETLVDRSGTSIRELEGSVMTVAALRALESTDAGNGRILVERALGKGITSSAGRPVRIGEIVQAVCAIMGVEREELLGAGRHRRVVCARGLAAHLAREMTTLSFPEIARALGRSSHSTIHAATARFAAMLERCELLPTRDENMSVADAVERTRREVFRVQNAA
ncbi:MAG: AAA family ATPase [Phycisphaerales bacterium]|nr:AAA family ATPase [Phycisphaerales bacterium]